MDNMVSMHTIPVAEASDVDTATAGCNRRITIGGGGKNK